MSPASVENLKFVVGKAIHSSNNHLSTVITSCDLLINQYTGEVQHRANVIKNRCKLMAEQLKALRQLSMLGEADMLTLNSIHNLCEKMYKEHLAEIKPNASIEFVNKISQDVKLHSPVQMTEILFGEVLKNAIQSLAYSNTNKKLITLSSEQLKDRLVIIISDSGPEIDADIKDYIFNPFYSTDKNKVGLGLNLSQQALLLLNGNIYYERADGLNIFKIEFSNITGNL